MRKILGSPFKILDIRGFFMNKIFAYIDSHIIWVVIVALMFWFAGWFVSGFPPLGLLFLVAFGIYFFRGFRREMKAGIQIQRTRFIHTGVVKFILFLFLFFVLSGIAKIIMLFTLWTFVWIGRGAEVADEAVMHNQKLVYGQTDIFIALPVVVILTLLYLRYLKQKRSAEELSVGKN